MVANSLIAARVTADIKQGFAAIAHQRGLTESTLLKRLIQASLVSANAIPTRVPEPVDPVAHGTRVSVRLRTDDLLLLRERATAGSQSAILDIASYGRGTNRSFTPAQRAQIARTVSRAPEVMVKVSGGARTLRGVGAHLAYVGRDDFEIETDMGERIQERSSQKALLEDWDLDLETHWHQSARAINEPRRSPKIVHNIIFSMPAGTDSKKVLQAVRMFAVNEWALKHRYAMVLHTNEE